LGFQLFCKKKKNFSPKTIGAPFFSTVNYTIKYGTWWEEMNEEEEHSQSMVGWDQPSLLPALDLVQC